MPSGSYLILPIEDSHKWKRIFTKERLKIISTLRKRNPISQTDLAKKLGRKRENVIYDLRVLEHLDIVRSERRGKRVIEKLNKNLIVIPC